jgi:hypothetical protein
MMSIILTAALALPLTQTTAPYVGTWTAEQSGRTFVRLELSTAGAAVRGRFSLGDIELDKTGALKTVTLAPEPLTPIADVKVVGSVVTFAHKDGDDTDHFRLTVLDKGTAELTLILSDEDRRELAESGISEFKPIRLYRK